MPNNQINFKHFEPLSKLIVVMASIGNHAQRTLFGMVTSIARYFYRFDRFLGDRKFQRRCRGKGAFQRNTLAVHHHSFRFFEQHPQYAFLQYLAITYRRASISAASLRHRKLWFK
jgi:hypothetical protein